MLPKVRQWWRRRGHQAAGKSLKAPGCHGAAERELVKWVQRMENSWQQLLQMEKTWMFSQLAQRW